MSHHPQTCVLNPVHLILRLLIQRHMLSPLPYTARPLVSREGGFPAVPLATHHHITGSCSCVRKPPLAIKWCGETAYRSSGTVPRPLTIMHLLLPSAVGSAARDPTALIHPFSFMPYSPLRSDLHRSSYQIRWPILHLTSVPSRRLQPSDLDRPCNLSNGQYFISALVHFQGIFKCFRPVLCMQRRGEATIQRPVH